MINNMLSFKFISTLYNIALYKSLVIKLNELNKHIYIFMDFILIQDF